MDVCAICGGEAVNRRRIYYRGPKSRNSLYLPLGWIGISHLPER